MIAIECMFLEKDKALLANVARSALSFSQNMLSIAITIHPALLDLDIDDLAQGLSNSSALAMESL